MLSSLSFYLVAFLMLALAVAIVLRPLLRATQGEALTDADGNLAVLRAQKTEIERDHARGAISEAERAAALDELAARTLEEIPGGQGPAAAASAPRRGMAALLGVLLVAMSVALYAYLGNRSALQSAPVQASADEPTEQQILAMVDSLAKKMEQNPGDPKGWVLLARSQAALGRFSEAAQAFDRAVALSPKDAQILADYADSVAMIQQGRFDGKPMELIKRALALDGNNLKALALAGTGELRMGNRAASLVHWKKLQGLLPRDSDDYREVEAIIRDVTNPAAAQATQAAQAASAGSVEPAKGQAADNGNAPAGAKIEGQVSLSPQLASQIAPGDTLFVFARASSGPKMPLAVMKIPVPKTWPQPYVLTDAMAMTPAMKLSAFSEVMVEARISKSGNALPQPGDLSGITGPVKPGAAGGGAVAITIDKKL